MIGALFTIIIVLLAIVGVMISVLSVWGLLIYLFETGNDKIAYDKQNKDREQG